MSRSEAPKLSKWTLFAYSLADMPVAMSLFPIGVFIPRFYSAELGVPLALIGTIFFVQRLTDALTDPLMGVISDRTRSRFGRRRPWVAASIPILMLAVYRLFFPSEGAGAGYLFAWSMLLSLGITMLLIPYYAWGAELSPDYNERSRITGARAMAGVVGSLAAQLVPSLALLFFGIGGTEAVLTIVGTTMLVLMPLCAGVTVSATPEARAPMTSQVPLRDGLRLMSRNRPFRLLISAFTIGQVGLSISTPLYAFFVADVLQSEDQTIYMLTFFFLSSLASIPFWVGLSRRIGKHIAFIASFTLIAFTHPLYFLLGEGDFWWMLPITIVTGFSSGGFSQSLPNSMKADVIDLDALESGENRAAFFFSAWSFAQKSAIALGGFLALPGLALFGFVPELGAANDETAMIGLRFLFSTFPSFFWLAGAVIVWRYPITEARHAEIRAQLEARQVAENKGE